MPYTHSVWRTKQMNVETLNAKEQSGPGSHVHRAGPSRSRSITWTWLFFKNHTWSQVFRWKYPKGFYIVSVCEMIWMRLIFANSHVCDWQQPHTEPVNCGNEPSQVGWPVFVTPRTSRSNLSVNYEKLLDEANFTSETCSDLWMDFFVFVLQFFCVKVMCTISKNTEHIKSAVAKCLWTLSD